MSQTLKTSLLGIAAVATLTLLPATLRAGEWVHPFDVKQPSSAPGELFAVIEIPHGSSIKYELDPETGYPVVDRFQSMPVAYPANYGSLPRTLAGDNDPLDVLVITREPVVPGAFIKVRVVAVMKATDGGEQDDKVIAVPATKIDPTFENVKDIGDLYEMDKQRIEQFFLVYKRLPAGKKGMEVSGWGNAEEARKIVQEALDRYSAKKAEPAAKN